MSKSLLSLIALALTVWPMLGSAQEAQPSPSVSMAEFCKTLPRSEYADLEQIESPDQWFELYKVADGVTAIYEPHQWQEVISYLIEGTQSALLFDAGNGIGDIAKLVNALTDKPIRVLNSHSHYDHVGGNYAFENILGMQTPFTIARQKGHENKDIAIEVSEQALCQSLPSGVSYATHVGRPYKIKTFVQDGQLIDLGERSLEVIHMPGHTPDAIALIDRDAGLMWTGDTYYSGPIWLFVTETDLLAYRSSLVRMIAESKNVKKLLPAHNVPLVAPSILQSVLLEFDAMLEGKLEKSALGDGMVEYVSKQDRPFSFLMRDEPLPYQAKP